MPKSRKLSYFYPNKMNNGLGVFSQSDVIGKAKATSPNNRAELFQTGQDIYKAERVDMTKNKSKMKKVFLIAVIGLCISSCTSNWE